MRLPWITWCDPSKETGVAMLYPDDRFWAGQAPFLESATWIKTAARSHGPQMVLGYERYYIIPGTPTDDAFHAIEMIGVIKLAAAENHCQLVVAEPRERKTATMAMLKRAGWWPKGKDAQSAAQHLASYLQRTGSLPPGVAARMSAASGTV